MIRDEAIEEIRERRRRLIEEQYGGSIDREKEKGTVARYAFKSCNVQLFPDDEAP